MPSIFGLLVLFLPLLSDHKLFRKYPFFFGEDEYDQLVKIIEILGSEEILKFQIMYMGQLDNHYKLTGYKKKPWVDISK